MTQNNLNDAPETVLPSLAEYGHTENLAEDCPHTAPVFLSPNGITNIVHYINSLTSYKTIEICIQT